MADSTMCDAIVLIKNDDGTVTTECPKKETCYRHMAPVNLYRQSYFVNAPLEKDLTCKEFTPL